MDPTERCTVAMTALFTPSEAVFLKDLMWRTRQPLSGWLRGVAIDAATRLARQQKTTTAEG